MRSILLLLIACLPATAHAYVGPGLGLGIVGVVLGVIVAIFLALFAILWYPFKSLLRKWRERGHDHSA